MVTWEQGTTKVKCLSHTKPVSLFCYKRCFCVDQNFLLWSCKIVLEQLHILTASEQEDIIVYIYIANLFIIPIISQRQLLLSDHTLSDMT